MTDDIHEMKTVIAKIKPEIESGEVTSFLRAKEAEENMVCAVFSPSKDKAGEETHTVLWNQGLKLEPDKWILRIKDNIIRSKKNRLLLLLVPVLILLLWFVFLRTGKKVVSIELMQSASAETISTNDKLSDQAIEDNSANIIETESIDLQRNVSLRNAIDALIAGRIDDSIGIYKEMLRISPDDESTALILKILTDNQGAKQ